MLSELRQRKLTRFFHILDRNKDGVLSPEDFQQTLDKIIHLRGWTWDNPDYEELHFFWTGFSHRLQVWADRNADGKITLKEWLWYLEQMLYLSEAPYVKQAIINMTLKAMDYSQDGKANSAEFQQFYQIYEIAEPEARQIFSKLDLNQDGFLDKDELIALFDEFLYSEKPEAEGNWFLGNY